MLDVLKRARKIEQKSFALDATSHIALPVSNLMIHNLVYFSCLFLFLCLFVITTFLLALNLFVVGRNILLFYFIKVYWNTCVSCL